MQPSQARVSKRCREQSFQMFFFFLRNCYHLSFSYSVLLHFCFHLHQSSFFSVNRNSLIAAGGSPRIRETAACGSGRCQFYFAATAPALLMMVAASSEVMKSKNFCAASESFAFFFGYKHERALNFVAAVLNRCFCGCNAVNGESFHGVFKGGQGGIADCIGV